jgi:hypothetical protein
VSRAGASSPDLARTTLALLARRPAGATICPSEVARAIAAAAGEADWRGEMPAVHAAVDAMVAEGLVRLSWKGEDVPARDGPYRIGRAGADQGAKGNIVTKHRIYTTSFASVYPHYVAKAEKKGRTRAELDEIIFWLTGYGPDALAAELEAGTDFERASSPRRRG